MNVLFSGITRWKEIQIFPVTHGGEGIVIDSVKSIFRFVFVCVFSFQVLRLTQKEQVLEERLANVGKENDELRASLASLHTRLALHDQLNQQHSQQVHTQIHHILALKTFLQSKQALLIFHGSSRQHKTAQCD